MKRLVSAVAVCCALLVSSGVAAAEQPSGAARAGAPATTRTAGTKPVDAKKLELSRRYFKVVNLEEKMRTMSDSMLPALMSEAKDMPAETRQAVIESISEAGVAAYRSMEERYVLMVAEIFSVEELQAMVDFYESPVGQSVLAKGNQLSAKSGQMMLDMLPIMKTEYETRFCAKTKREAGCLTKSDAKS